MGKEYKALSSFSWQRLPQSRRSWVDVVHDSVDRLGINRWLFYFAVMVATIMVLQGLHWLSGALPFGHFTAPLVYTGAVSAFSIGSLHHVDTVALRALQRFRPALPDDEVEYTRMAHVLTTMPAAPVWWCHLVGLLLFISIIYSDPTFYGLLRGYPLSDTALYLIGYLNNTILVINLYHTLHQLSWVQTIHARAKTISLIDRSPAFAFSTLTYWTTVLGLGIVYGFIYFFPALRQNSVAISMAGSAALVLLLLFFLPLHGIHMRLVEDKERRLGHVRQQIDATFSLLHDQRKAADLAAAEQVAKQLPSLIQEEEYLSKLPTWPWASGTVTKLISVALLPLLLLAAERLIVRLMH
jgi:hypothetical protein